MKKMNNFYKGGRGLAFSQREEGTCFRKEKSPQLSKILNHPVGEDSHGLPSATVREVVGVSSEYRPNLFDTCSGAVRIVTEEQPKRTRSASEGHPNSTRRNRWIFAGFLRKLKVETTRGLSDLITTQAQPKDDLRITQERSKDDLRMTQQRPSLGTAYRQGSPKDDTINTQETANNDPRNIRLMYRECTVNVRGVYRKGTIELLRSYWRATTDLLNVCTSGVDQWYSKSRGVVGLEAMKTKAVPLMTVWLCFSRRLFSLMALKNIRILCLGFLCFMLFNLSDAWAQSAETRTAEGQIEIKPLQVGDTIPEELWNMPLQVVNHPDGKATLTLNDYRDKKLIILDFWATWCGSCLRSFTNISSLQGQLDDKVQFLMVNCLQSGDTEVKIKNTFESVEPDRNLSFINHDSIFQHLFPHRLLPHYVWLSGKGEFLASSGSAELTKENMEKILRGQQVSFHQKRDNLKFDKSKSLLEQLDKIGIDKLKSSSLLTAYTEGIGTGYGFDSVGKAQRLYYLNTPLNFLYQYAFADILEDIDVGRFIFDTSIDSAFIQQYKSPANYDSKYCYELTFDSDSIDVLKAVMRSDLEQAFGVTLERQMREEQVCQLTGVSEKKAQTSEKVISIGYLVRMLNKISEVPIIVDNELARKRLTLELPDPADKLDLKTVQRFLENNGVSHKLTIQSIPFGFFHKVNLQNSYNDASL